MHGHGFVFCTLLVSEEFEKANVAPETYCRISLTANPEARLAYSGACLHVFPEAPNH